MKDDIDRWSGPVRSLIEGYRRDHPGTEKSDEDIARSLADYLVYCGVMEVKGGVYVLVGGDHD